MRFPEFKGEWDDVQLGNLLTFKNGLNCDAEKYGKGIKNISVSDVLQFSPITYSSVRGSVDATEQQKEEFKVSFGDVLFQRSSETPEDIGRSNVYLDQQPCVFGGFVIRGKPIKGFNPLFFKYLMATKSARHEVIKRGAGAQHYNIGQEQLALVKVRMPEDEEQCKISSFLNVIDRRIDVQRKTIEDYEIIKSSAIDDCFCSNKHALINGHVSDFLTYSKDKKADSPSRKQLITVKLNEMGVEKSANTETLKMKGTQYFIRTAGEFIYGKQNIFHGAFGVVPKELDGYCSSGDVPSMSFLPGVNRGFFLRIVSHDYRSWEKYASGTGSKRIHEDQLLAIPITYPPKVQQDAIEKKLDAIDNIISVSVLILKKLEMIKDYLLRNMFI